MSGVLRKPNLSLFAIASLSLVLAACTPQHSGNNDLKSLTDEFTHLDEPSAQAYLRIASRFESTGDLAGALHFYNQALQKEDNNLDAYEGLARIYAQGGAFDQAAVVLERIIDIAPMKTNSAIELSKIYIQQERYAEALKLVEKQLLLGESDVSLYNIKGVALDLLNRHDEAQMAYADGLDRAPNDADILTNMALSFALSDMSETAIGLLVGFSTDEGELGQSARSNLAVIHALNGDITGALAIAATLYSESDLSEMEKFYTAVSHLEGDGRTYAVFFGKLPDDFHQAVVEPTPEVLPTFSPEEEKLIETAPPAIYWVQMASYRTIPLMRRGWEKLQENHRDILEDAEPFTLFSKRAIRSKYRLFAAGYSTKADANDLCGALKNSGADCLVIRLSATPIPIDEIEGQ